MDCADCILYSTSFGSCLLVLQRERGVFSGLLLLWALWQEEFYVHFPFKFQMAESKLQVNQAPCDNKLRWLRIRIATRINDQTRMFWYRSHVLDTCWIMLIILVKSNSSPSNFDRTATFLHLLVSLLVHIWRHVATAQVAKWPLMIYLHGSGGGTFMSFAKRNEHRNEGAQPTVVRRPFQREIPGVCQGRGETGNSLIVDVRWC